MVSEANLLVLLWLNQPFLIANSELLKIIESWVARWTQGKFSGTH